MRPCDAYPIDYQPGNVCKWILTHAFSISVLLNKWEKLLSKIKENIQHTEVYESLKSDIVSLRLDLTKVLEDRERDDDIHDDAELEQKLHTFRVGLTNDFPQKYSNFQQVV